MSTPTTEVITEPTSLLGRARRYVNQGGPVQRRLELGLVVLMSATLLAFGNGLWRPKPRAVSLPYDAPTDVLAEAKQASCDDPVDQAKFLQWIDSYEERTATRGTRAPVAGPEIKGYAACARKLAEEDPNRVAFFHAAARNGRSRTMTWLLGTATFAQVDLDRAVGEADPYPAIVAMLVAHRAEAPDIAAAAHLHAPRALQHAAEGIPHDLPELTGALNDFLQSNAACTVCGEKDYLEREAKVVGLLIDKGARVDGAGLAGLCARGPIMTDANLERALAHRLPGAIEGAIGSLDAAVPEPVARRVVAEGIDWGYRDGEDDAAMPLVQAIGNRNEAMVRLLLDRGAPVSRVYKDGSSALQAAVTCSDGETVCGRVVELLLAHGADANRRFPDGTTPLFAAAEAGNGRVIRALLDHGARLETRVLRETALNAAERQGNTLAARILAAHGAQVPPQMP
jgi:hypothetical protein